MATLFIGTYSYGVSRGIYRSRFNIDTGDVANIELAAELPDPGYLCLDADAAILYSTANPLAGDGLPSVVAFHISASGALQRIGSAVAEKLKFCQMSLSPDRKLLFAAAYGDAAAAVFRLEDGIPVLADVIRFSEASCAVADRQSEPHVHSVTPSVSGNCVFVCENGEWQQILVLYSADCVLLHFLRIILGKQCVHLIVSYITLCFLFMQRLVNTKYYFHYCNISIKYLNIYMHVYVCMCL